jgi:hypothetical protein
MLGVSSHARGADEAVQRQGLSLLLRSISESTFTDRRTILESDRCHFQLFMAQILSSDHISQNLTMYRRAASWESTSDISLNVVTVVVTFTGATVVNLRVANRIRITDSRSVDYNYTQKSVLIISHFQPSLLQCSRLDRDVAAELRR